MSRHKQRRLAQLRQTVEEKISLLQRQKADFVNVICEYINEAEVSAASLLSSGNADVDVDRYLHVIRQLDRRSQVCLQLTSKAYDVIDDNEGLESEEEGGSHGGAGDGQDSDNDGHPRLAASGGVRGQVTKGSVSIPSQQSVATGKKTASPSSMPEADQPQHLLHGHHQHGHHQETAQHPSALSASSNIHNHHHHHHQHPHQGATSDQQAHSAFPLFSTAASHPSLLPSTAAAHLSTDLTHQVAASHTYHVSHPAPAAAHSSTAHSKAVSTHSDANVAHHHTFHQPASAAVQVSASVTHPATAVSAGASRNSPEGAGVEPDTYWRFEIGILQLPHEHAVPLKVSHVENPWSFYVLTSHDTVTRLNQEIRDHVEHAAERLAVPRVGGLCLAKFSDDVYYRARIQHIHGDAVGVYYLDFGNVHTAMCTELLVMPGAFKDLPDLALHCCLSGVKPVSKSGLWTEAAVNIFWQYVAEQQLMCKAVREPSDNPPVPCIVELYRPTPVPCHKGANKSEHAVANISIASILIEQKVAQPVSMSSLLQLLSAAATSYDNLPLGAEAATYPLSSPGLTLRSPPSSRKNQQDRTRKTSGKKCTPLSPDAAEFVPSAGRRKLGPHKLPRLPGQVECGSEKVSGAVDFTSGAGEDEKDCKSAVSQQASGMGLKSNKTGSISGHSPTQQLGGFDLRGNKGCAKSLTSNGEKQSAKDGASSVQGTVAGAAGVRADRNEGNSSEILSTAVKCKTASEVEVLDWKAVGASLLGDVDNPDKITSFFGMAAAVNSPTDFYIHPVCKATGSRLKSMMEDLNKEFEHMQKATMERQSRSFVAKPGGVCCARFSKDNCFYRAVVLDARTLSDNASESSRSPERHALQVHVFYIDFGDKEWLPSYRVFPLPLPYQYIQPQALWCSLICVSPPHSISHNSMGRGGAYEDTKWPAEACRAFSRLVGEERVLTVIAQSGEVPTEKCRADAVQKKPLRALLVDQQDEDLCINHELILQKVAVFTNTTATSAASDADGGAMDEEGWDDMKKDSNSLRNTYNVDVDDAGVAISGVKARGGSSAVCRFYNKPSSCWKGKQCPYLHVDPGKHQGMSGNLKQVLVFDEDQSSILPAEGESVAVEVSSVRTPSHFYVTLPWGSLTIPQVTSMSSEVMEHLEGETLDRLNAALVEFYKGKRLDTDYSVYAMGEAVAAYCKRSKAWLRAKVVDTDPDEEEVLVMYVDFGDKEWVSERDIRQLDKCFIHLPPQAVECSLVKVIPPRPRVAWPAESRREFWSLVNKKTLVARVVKRMWSGRLMVELFDTSSGEDVDIGATLIRRNLASLDTSSPISQLMSPGDGGDQVHYIPG